MPALPARFRERLVAGIGSEVVEGEEILTSMNLYEFSQVNNHEMGAYLTEQRRLIRISDEIRVSVEKVLSPSRPRAAWQTGPGTACGSAVATD
jgi:hypothetical protein